MIQRLTLQDFDHTGVSYGFFGRRGGVSTGHYASLNCRNGSDDDPENVAENKRRVCAEIGARAISNLYQVHGDTVLTLGKPLGDKRPEADAMVTDKPDVARGVLTADCMPVLFHGHKADGSLVIGAAHAGWRGALGGVLDRTIKAMSDLGAEPGTITAAIGPCIAQESYEVSAEFYEEFLRHDPENKSDFILSGKDGHYMFDLPGYGAARLRGCGVRRVILSGVDTYANEDDYFSYRRNTHQNISDYGGQVSVIMIQP